MRNRLVPFLASLSLLALMATGAMAQESGVIEGQVLNGTSGGASLEGVPITLSIFRGQEEETSLEGIVDSEGRFRFQDLDTEGYVYQVEVEHQGVRYASDVVVFPQGAFAQEESVLSVPLTVYDSTVDDADISVERAHLILDFEPEVVSVQEVQILLNGGDKTYVGSTGEEGGPTLLFSLPEGATELQLIEGLMSCCVVEVEGGFASDEPVFPGSDQFVFNYKLGHQSATYTISKGMPYPISSLDVLVADAGVEVTAPGLTAQEPQSLGGRRYLHLTGQNLTPADGLTLHLANLPLQDGPTESSTTVPDVFGWVVMGLGTLAVFVVLGYPLLKRRQGEEA